jgi:hypothetical protein
MVHLLVKFVVICPDNSKVYPFEPNFPGPGGLTPLHLAASIENAEDIVDALTDDPQQVCSVKFSLLCYLQVIFIHLSYDFAHITADWLKLLAVSSR